MSPPLVSIDETSQRSGALPGLKSSARFARAFFIGIGLFLQAAGFAQTIDAYEADDAKEACVRQLRICYEAIQEFRRQNKDLPNQLSQLIPDYLASPDVLFCPSAKRRGRTSVETTAGTNYNLSDTRTSYSYEFSPLPLDHLSTDGRAFTMRDWKRLQMGLVGSKVPLIRCHSHERHINLSFGGEIYESDLNWENEFADVVPVENLWASRLFPAEAAIGSTKVRVIRILPRSPETGSHLIDLSSRYNADLTAAWHGDDFENHLAELPAGLVELGGVPFDARGLVQLAAGAVPLHEFPEAVRDIPVNRVCQRLHFLHAASFAEKPGVQIGKFVVHDETGATLELPIVYGKTVADWWHDPRMPFDSPDTRVAWEGANEATRRQKRSLRLYHTVWELPKVRVRTLDYVSEPDSTSAPFLIAVTTEPSD